MNIFDLKQKSFFEELHGLLWLQNAVAQMAQLLHQLLAFNTLLAFDDCFDRKNSFIGNAFANISNIF